MIKIYINCQFYINILIKINFNVRIKIKNSGYLMKYNNRENKIRSTTVLAVKKDNIVAMAADGQVTLGNTVMKSEAKKIRRIYENKVLIGFAGSTADAFSLFDKFEAKLNEYRGNILRASVELAKDWSPDRLLKSLTNI